VEEELGREGAIDAGAAVQLEGELGLKAAADAGPAAGTTERAP